MGCEWDRYYKTGYMGEKSIKKDTWAGDRARNMENENLSELRELYKEVGIVANNKKKRLECMYMQDEWIGEGELRKYLRINRREVEEGEGLDPDGWKTQEDLREIKFKRWGQKAVDSEESAS